MRTKKYLSLILMIPFGVLTMKAHVFAVREDKGKNLSTSVSESRSVQDDQSTVDESEKASEGQSDKMLVDKAAKDKNLAQEFRKADVKEVSDSTEDKKCSYHINEIYKIGKRLLTGNGVTKNVKRAIELLQEAAAHGHIDAQCILGKFYMGIKDYTNAINFFRAAAAQGNSEALYELGYYYSSEGRDLEAAFKYYKQAAEKEHVDAQFCVGRYYLHALGTNQDIKQAVLWFDRASKKGSVCAMNSLALLYLNGAKVKKEGTEEQETVVKKDVGEAFKLFQKSAGLGNVVAQYNLALRYLNGEGVAKDAKVAVHWFTEAAKNGDMDAMFWMGLCYLYGIGVSQDLIRAYQLISYAAHHESIPAMFMFNEVLGM